MPACGGSEAPAPSVVTEAPAVVVVTEVTEAPEVTEDPAEAVTTAMVTEEPFTPAEGSPYKVRQSNVWSWVILWVITSPPHPTAR